MNKLDNSEKIKKAIEVKLTSLGAYVDKELPEYIAVMISNKKNKEDMEKDLQLFLGSETTKFISWLNEYLNKINNRNSDSKTHDKSNAKSKTEKSAVIEKKKRSDKDREREKEKLKLKTKKSEDKKEIKSSRDKDDKHKSDKSKDKPRSKDTPVKSKRDESGKPPLKKEEDVKKSVSNESNKEVKQSHKPTMEVDPMVVDTPIILSSVIKAPQRPSQPDNSILKTGLQKMQKDLRAAEKTMINYEDICVDMKSKSPSPEQPVDSQNVRSSVFSRLGAVNKFSIDSDISDKPKPVKSLSSEETAVKIPSRLEGRLQQQKLHDDSSNKLSSRLDGRLSKRHSNDELDHQKLHDDTSNKLPSRLDGRLSKRHSNDELDHQKLHDDSSNKLPSRLDGRLSKRNSNDDLDHHKLHDDSSNKLSSRLDGRLSKRHSNDELDHHKLHDDSSNKLSSRLDGRLFKPTLKRHLNDDLDLDSRKSRNYKDLDRIDSYSDDDEDKFRRRHKAAKRSKSPNFIVTLKGAKTLNMPLSSRLGPKINTGDHSSPKKKNGIDLNDEEVLQYDAMDTEFAVDEEDQEMVLTDKSQPQQQQQQQQQPSQEQIRCRFWPNCTKPDSCPFRHPTEPCTIFPYCPLKATQCLYVHPKCKFDLTCANPQCLFTHSSNIPGSVGISTTNLSVSRCIYYPNCTNLSCKYFHPSKPCKFGANCLNKDHCLFFHPALPHFTELKWVAPGKTGAVNAANSRAPNSNTGNKPSAVSTATEESMLDEDVQDNNIHNILVSGDSLPIKPTTQASSTTC